MPDFYYKGRHTNGEEVQGKLFAKDTNNAAHLLLQQEIIPADIRKMRTDGLLRSISLFNPRVSESELQLFTRQLFALLQSGLPLVLAIQGIMKTDATPAMQQILAEVHQQLIEGNTFAQALRKHPKTFDSLYVSMVNMGESTGKLEANLKELALYIDNQQKIKRQLKQATRYPLFVLAITLLGFLGVNLFVIPKFVVLFSNIGGELPLATQVIVGCSNFLRDYGGVLLIAVLMAAFMLLQYSNTYQGCKQFDRLKLATPVIGPLLHQGIQARFCQSLSLMLSSGLVITEALSLASGVLNNSAHQEHILDMRQRIEGGTTLTQAAVEANIFSDMVLQMLAIGEESGQLAHLLHEVAEYYHEDLNYKLTKLSSSLEPFLIITMGCMITLLALGIYLPMWSMMDSYV